MGSSMLCNATCMDIFKEHMVSFSISIAFHVAVFQSIDWCKLRENCRNIPYFMGNCMVSCRSPLQPIQWFNQASHHVAWPHLCFCNVWCYGRWRRAALTLIQHHCSIWHGWNTNIHMRTMVLENQNLPKTVLVNVGKYSIHGASGIYKTDYIKTMQKPDGEMNIFIPNYIYFSLKFHQTPSADVRMC